MLRISQLTIYPIKSMGGITVARARVTDRGLEHDRRWMLIDHNNIFLTQREFPAMALMKVELTPEGLLVRHPSQPVPLNIPFHTSTGASTGTSIIEVCIWDDTCPARLVSREADDWFSSALNTHCRLVHMPDETARITDPRYAPGGSITSFADGYPFLLIGQASLDELNGRLDQPLPMDRFRPNIVFTGGSPYQEDALQTFSIHNIRFHGVKLCARCMITTIDQVTARQGKEPLRTLARYRARDHKILFGQNLVHQGTGELAVGDELVLA
jgi:uncharacterized protein YcbX